MKAKKLGKKLTLSKTTIANLDQQEQRTAKAGYVATKIAIFGGCDSWMPLCYTKPVAQCVTIFSACEVCLETYTCAYTCVVC